MVTAFGPGCAFGDPPLDGPTLSIFAGDAVALPLTWWQMPPVYGSDGKTVVTPGVPVDMAGMTPGAEFLSYAQEPGTGVALSISLFDAAAATWTVTAPGRGQMGDLTSALPSPAPAKIFGPRIRVHYTDAAGQHTFGTFYLAVR